MVKYMTFNHTNVSSNLIALINTIFLIITFMPKGYTTFRYSLFRMRLPIIIHKMRLPLFIIHRVKGA